MTARRAASTTPQPSPDAMTAARMIPSSTAVMGIVLRVAGQVAVRLDLTHAGTPQQQLGMSLGTVLIYLRSGGTARTVGEQWTRAQVLTLSLAPALAGRRSAPLQVGPSTVGALVRMGGLPRVTASFLPARAGLASSSPMVRLQVGPVLWEVLDATAFGCLERAWRDAARMLGDPCSDLEA